MLHYHKSGQGPAIVLIHGFPLDHHLWDKIVPELSGHFTVICPDLPGAGQSEGHTPLDFDYMARRIKEILEKESIPKAIIGGHSMGGYTALAFAALFPESVAALALIHSSAFADNEEKKATRLKTIRLITGSSEGKQAFLKAMAPGMFAPSFSREHPEAVPFIISSGMAMPAAALAAFQTAIMNRPDRQAVLKSIQVPVFWAIGDQDSAAPQEDVVQQIVLPQICDAQFYSPCGHCSMLEMPGRLAADLVNFGSYVSDM